MKSINEYQKDFGLAAKEKFPLNKKWTQEDRLLSMQRQLADIGAALQIENKKSIDKCIHNTTDHAIACLIADALILGHKRKTNMIEELDKALDWFKKAQEHSAPCAPDGILGDSK